MDNLAYQKRNWDDYCCKRYLLLEPLFENKLNTEFMTDDSILRDFLFTAGVSLFRDFLKITYNNKYLFLVLAIK